MIGYKRRTRLLEAKQVTRHFVLGESFLLFSFSYPSQSPQLCRLSCLTSETAQMRRAIHLLAAVAPHDSSVEMKGDQEPG